MISIYSVKGLNTRVPNTKCEWMDQEASPKKMKKVLL